MCGGGGAPRPLRAGIRRVDCCPQGGGDRRRRGLRDRPPRGRRIRPPGPRRLRAAPDDHIPVPVRRRRGLDSRHHGPARPGDPSGRFRRSATSRRTSNGIGRRSPDRIRTCHPMRWTRSSSDGPSGPCRIGRCRSTRTSRTTAPWASGCATLSDPAADVVADFASGYTVVRDDLGVHHVVVYALPAPLRRLPGRAGAGGGSPSEDSAAAGPFPSSGRLVYPGRNAAAGEPPSAPAAGLWGRYVSTGLREATATDGSSRRGLTVSRSKSNSPSRCS